MCIDLVLADPYPMMLEGLAQAFEGSSEFSVKSCVTNGEDALHALKQHRPHILVMDLSLSHRSGLALLAEIKMQKWLTKPVVFTGLSNYDIKLGRAVYEDPDEDDAYVISLGGTPEPRRVGMQHHATSATNFTPTGKVKKTNRKLAGRVASPTASGPRPVLR